MNERLGPVAIILGLLFGLAVIAGIIWWQYGGTGSQAQAADKLPFKVTYEGFDAAGQRIAEKALHELVRACPEFDRYAGDLVPGSARAIHVKVRYPSFDGYAEDYGWRDYIRLELTVKDARISIPRRFYARGHTLFYYLGGDPTPGISIAKGFQVHFEPGETICGHVTQLSRWNVFIPDENMRVLDALH